MKWFGAVFSMMAGAFGALCVMRETRFGGSSNEVAALGIASVVCVLLALAGIAADES